MSQDLRSAAFMTITVINKVDFHYKHYGEGKMIFSPSRAKSLRVFFQNWKYVWNTALKSDNNFHSLITFE
jgi:hypothetical protein